VPPPPIVKLYVELADTFIVPVATPPAPPPPPRKTPAPPPLTTRYSIEDTCGRTGVTELEALDAAEVPAADVAVTVNVYAVPAVNPLTVIGEEASVPVSPPGEEVTV
jgi:hypothetical protein